MNNKRPNEEFLKNIDTQKTSIKKFNENIRKKKEELDTFLGRMDDYQPIIPDAVTQFYLEKSGVDCPDIRVGRLLSLAAQKFIADISQDAFQYSKLRQQGMNAKERKVASKKTVLTMDDLSLALRDYGVNIRKPDFYS
jgi:transcription initiation factor TFIID subunit 10